ncbi:GlsB/YeaQ/YmgE family stress response membrane protein [Kushneria phosphatilytica]|uniref:Uncharacterized protein n=1 Tax=Kushneria phosphatilytica TaxID=657387 RepID=A0A1S1NXY3_9GAMM|nr:hypothetical protein [Kushneria phosphatilytica]OHV09734.1 hypothetical protein BH688_10885 [Kushneria phosphatilytica]QEL11780.1 hypothetical protein FY550_11950 [Kushneria phosphatilytica]
MNLISWLFVSLLIGVILSFLTPSRYNAGALGSMGISAVGGVAFGFISTLFGLAAELHFDFHSLIAAMIGAVVGWAALLAYIIIAQPQLHD